MFDQKNRKGIIYNKIIYGKRTKTVKDRAGPSNKQPRMDDANEDSENGNGSNEANVNDHENVICDNDNITNEAFIEAADELIKFFEQCKTPQDVPKIKKKFEETVDLRKKMVSDLDKYKRLFELYLVLPELVR